MNAVEAATEYLQDEIIPHISQIYPTEDLCAVIGGSVSFGFNDEHSDVDVYLIWNAPGNAWLPKLRDCLFDKKLIHGYSIQYIPIDLGHKVNEVLRTFLCDNENSTIAVDDFTIMKLYELSNFIALHDPKKKIHRAQSRIKQIGEKWWTDTCNKKCAEHIDVLEALYACGKRDDLVSTVTLFGQAVDGVMKTIYLAARNFFPFGKWLYRGLQTVDETAYVRIGKFLRECRFTTEGLVSTTREMMKWTVERLKEKVDLPEYLIADLLNP